MKAKHKQYKERKQEHDLDLETKMPQYMELATPNVDNNVNFKLKSGLIHLLPTFNGLAGEDPHTHFKEFYMVCVGMKPNGVDEEHVKLKAFPFSLKGAVEAWVFSILPGSIGTWNAMKKIFLEKYFLASQVPNIRKEICGIWQSHDMCPTMLEDYIKQAYAVNGGFNGQPQYKYDPFSNTYNPGWRDHPNLRYGNPPQQANQGRHFHPYGFQS
ncbi:hypothetical protein D5086_014157 [Populus alba]|uniref:Uncharacterized protein n=1 Tax=Populus alba TaxID=43335 RepID=A0ACC4C701_POPAL